MQKLTDILYLGIYENRLKKRLPSVLLKVMIHKNIAKK